MEAFEPKKLSILRILQVLQEFSDCDHKLRQGEIISLLKIQYDIECERKAVARNIDFLQQAGYDIVRESDGIYLASRKFEPGELRLLIDSVLSNRNVCKAHTKEIIKKLTAEGGKYFKSYAKHVTNLDDWQKDENRDYFYNIELCCEAIEQQKKLSFFYNYFDIDKRKQKNKPEKSKISAYRLFLKNGHYYLACNYDRHDNLAFIRLDRMSDIEILQENARALNTVKNCEQGINLGKLDSHFPFMYSDKPERIEFITANNATHMIDNVIDTFGQSVNITDIGDGNYKFSLTASPSAMRFWLLQYGKYVKLLSPQSLVEQIKSDIKEIRKLYQYDN